jgi:hypothetical protein
MGLVDRALTLTPSFARGWFFSGVLRLWAGQPADSDEVARAFRDDVARDYEMMSPGFGASLACILFALGRCRSSVLDNV